MKLLRLLRPIVVLAFVPALFALSGCSSSPTVPFYSSDSFGSDSPYQKHVPDGAAAACSAAERTLLGDGYIIDGDSSKGSFKGRKAYRIDGNRSSFIEMNIVCLSDSTGSTIYANGVNSTYDLKKASSSASVGVSILGSVSLPIGQTVDSMVKVANETITDRVFYQRFFESVEKNLVNVRVEIQSKHKEDELPTSVVPVLPSMTTPVPPTEAAPAAPAVPATEPTPEPTPKPQTSGDLATAPATSRSAPVPSASPVPVVNPSPVQNSVETAPAPLPAIESTSVPASSSGPVTTPVIPEPTAIPDSSVAPIVTQTPTHESTQTAPTPSSTSASPAAESVVVPASIPDTTVQPGTSTGTDAEKTTAP
ncbi:DUF2242 domain-containing protein [Halothiobacillus sp.]|uniref:DUF2242 domain-containing protein n=1 Tax=Halothiobacillus sp. TaxID=1891311 RepID=UPI003D0BA61E